MNPVGGAWYCRYPIGYRDEMLERGIRSTIRSIAGSSATPGDGEVAARWFWRRGFDPSWRPDETYVKVRGQVDPTCTGQS